jgi:hypothetical protein
LSVFSVDLTTFLVGYEQTQLYQWLAGPRMKSLTFANVNFISVTMPCNINEIIGRTFDAKVNHGKISHSRVAIPPSIVGFDAISRSSRNTHCSQQSLHSRMLITVTRLFEHPGTLVKEQSHLNIPACHPCFLTKSRVTLPCQRNFHCS